MSKPKSKDKGRRDRDGGSPHKRKARRSCPEVVLWWIVLANHEDLRRLLEPSGAPAVICPRDVTRTVARPAPPSTRACRVSRPGRASRGAGAFLA